MRDSYCEHDVAAQNVMRSRMSPEERDLHDDAWSFSCSDPKNATIMAYDSSLDVEPDCPHFDSVEREIDPEWTPN